MFAMEFPRMLEHMLRRSLDVRKAHPPPRRKLKESEPAAD